MSRLLVRPVVVALFVYLLSLGATFNGVVSPEIGVMTLALTAILVAVWLFIRWRSGWKWYRSPLDGVFILWAIAFVVSLVANWDAARRIAIGLWYVSLYIGLWYVLHDALANRLITRDTLVDGLLISGVIILAIGYWQLQSWFVLALREGLSLGIPRPVSLFGNPNFLSGFLIVLIPFLFSRIFLARRIQRIFLGIYALLALLLLFLTYSRAAWLGMAAGGTVWILLLLAQNGLLSKSGFLAWWGKQTRIIRTTVLASTALTLIVTVGVAFIFIRSFSQTGRTADLRGDIYTGAIELFAEKPLTGQGLFTFGRGLVRLTDIQPDKPHSHAHNAVLHIAAELGIIGLIALAGTLFVMTRGMRTNWREMPSRERVLLAGAIGAVVAFAGDQLGDIPAMMPAIALTGLIGLFLALAPLKAKPVNARWQRSGLPIGVAALWVALFVTGFWSNGIYGQYVDALGYAVSTNDYQGGVERLQPVLEADPNLSLYTMEEAFLLGMQASEGNSDAAHDAISAYERFIALDPGYALAWANKAALHWQLGEQAEALQAIHEAIRLDSNVWQYYLDLARYAEAMGDTDTAHQAYDQILQLYPDASLYPDLDQLTIRRELSSKTLELTPAAQVVLLLDNHQPEQAVQFWQENAPPETIANDVIQVLLALTENNRDDALTTLARAETLVSSPSDEAWVHLGRSRVAQFVGEMTLADSELAEARKLVIHEPLDADDYITSNVAYAQFLRFIIPRLYLPQVDYHFDDPVLVHLLAGAP